MTAKTVKVTQSSDWPGFISKSILVTLGAILSLFILTQATQAKMEALRVSQNQQTFKLTTAADVTRQLECLARNIYYEAGGEPFEGKVAVAQVTLNRVTSGLFPSDVCQVVYQKSKIYEKVVCQFSWYCQGAGKTKPANQEVYAESMEVAKKVLLEGFRLPSLTDALYFHAEYVNPQWGKERLAKVGRHIFYSQNRQ